MGAEREGRRLLLLEEAWEAGAEEEREDRRLFLLEEAWEGVVQLQVPTVKEWGQGGERESLDILTQQRPMVKTPADSCQPSRRQCRILGYRYRRRSSLDR